MERLLELLQDARAAESEARDARIALEEEIVSRIADAPESGSATIKAGGYRATVKFALRYQADVDAIRSLDLDVLPLKFRPPAYEFDARAYEAMRESHPEAFRAVAAHVSTKQAKPAVTLKV